MLLRTENERLSNKVMEPLRENLSLKGMSQEQRDPEVPYLCSGFSNTGPRCRPSR